MTEALVPSPANQRRLRDRRTPPLAVPRMGGDLAPSVRHYARQTYFVRSSKKEALADLSSDARISSDEERIRDLMPRQIRAVLSEAMLASLRELAMDPSKAPEAPASRCFRLFFEKRGRAEVKAEGKQEALLAVLDARVPVADAGGAGSNQGLHSHRGALSMDRPRRSGFLAHLALNQESAAS
ncbi:hypothetical protein WMF28_12340 [Sorangium sp. So ce590]|uniref:hypothetical protein n=1 Tax=Sorangium sp. So ce590 TaxID=3133317 RepID=UPI003F61DF4E